MKKSIAALLLVLLLLGAAGTYLGSYRESFTLWPFHKSMPFDGLSKAISDGHNNLFVIDNAKKTIHKLNGVGVLQYSITSETGKNGEVYRFNDMAVDDSGYLYTIRTLLDPYGISVKSEQIVRYTPEGQFDRSLFSQEYNDAGDQRYRLGSLRNVQVHDGKVYFFNDEVQQLTLYQSPTGLDEQSEPKSIFTIKLPQNKYVSEADGFKPGDIYYSTRSGEIYRAFGDGHSELVYPLEGLDRTRRNFPESMHLDNQGRLIFIDFNNKMISRLDPKQPYTIEGLVTEEKAAASGVELAFDATSSSIAEDGSLIIVEPAQINRRLPDGTITPSMVEALYSKPARMSAFILWSVAVAALLLVLYAIKLFFFNLLQRRLPLMMKQILILVPVIAVSMILLSTVIYESFSKKMEEETFSELVLLAKNGQNLVDGDKLESLTSPLDYNGAIYQTFRKKIQSVFENNARDDNQGFYKAVYKYENGIIYRILEDDDGMHMFNPFQQTPENQQVVLEGKPATGQWQDFSGEWRYAIAPIFNSAGKIVGVFETSKNLDGILKHRQIVLKSIIRNIALISVGLLLVLVLMTYVLLSSIRKLRNSVGEIAKGNWDTVVTINTRDEVSDLGDSVNTMAARIRDYITKVENFSQSYYRFVPQQFLRFLNKESILEVQLGDQVEKNMSILIFNIRGFYLLSKRLTPEENFNFVNSFLSRFGPYVRKHQGLMNKYLGAGFMALFPNQADEALQACIEMRKELELYNSHRAKVGYSPLDFGIGLHKGPLRLGIIGEEQRLEGNVISDGVNVAAVLEKMTEPLGASILITNHVVQSLQQPSGFQYRNLGLIQVEGVKEPLRLFDVYQGDPDTIRALKEKTKVLFEQAVTYYQVGRFYDAREAFLMVIKQNRQDKAAQLYFYICDEYFQNGTTAEWNGTLSVS
ncbi:adenylate/guanylate cyclase domain-containing protein [Paenibacillus aceris]|uniref:Class 3 adenylate cyclase/HAMP domain-containing protein n=1 Tax=Paenibacillus aceris TaxID=869555 RepID=A0ABS4I608_9BACL|nr:adenylate/guanylate cyclase domain-containing protein [Paenibacillus aceris]MBP1966270.1 class 3 adenylate cyclase/HAMP domain-containing protein [Paenibacillus aceris]NHW38531.1 HAMP domain-containing protein [Paenibacillus aceris]